MLAASTGATAAATGSASAATSRHGVEFDRVVNVVDDLGLDSSGNEPVQGKLNNADQEGTLFVFPEGEYLVTSRILLLYNNAVGVLGKGDARFVVPGNYNREALIIDRGQQFVFENMDLDLRANGATPGYKFGAHDAGEIHDVEFIGQGIHPNSNPRGESGGNPDVENALSLIAREDSTHLIIENVVARNDGLMGAYNRGSGRVGVWVGSNSEGTVTLRNCEISGFPNNGMYTSRTPGVVQVEGGLFRNNDVAQVRLGSEGSYVKGARIEVDPSNGGSPNPNDLLNARGVRIESGRIKTGGVTVRDCDIHIAEGIHSEGGVVVGGPGGKFDVLDTRIKVDADRAHGVFAKHPASGKYGPPWPRRGYLKNVSITGSANDGQAVQIRGRGNSVIDSCCIDQSGAGRDAMRLVDSSGITVKQSTLDVSGELYERVGTNVKNWGNSRSGSCPLPSSNGGTATASRNGGDDSGSQNDGGNDGSSDTASGTKRITISGGGSQPVSYTIQVSGRISGTDSSEGEVRSSTTASGKVRRQWTDAFEFTGEIEKLVVDGAATLKYLPGSNRMLLQNNNTGRGLSYDVHVGHNAWRTKWSDGESTPENADVGKTFHGTLNGWVDEWGCTGGLISATIEDTLSVDVSDA